MSAEFPIEKAGICSRFKFRRKSYPARFLVYEWCELEYEGDHTYWDFGDEMIDLKSSEGTLIQENTEPLRSEMTTYEDKTDEILERMMWAESVAVPEDFTEVDVDNGGLVGYTEALRRIWLQHHPECARNQ